MIALDTNILVHARRREARHHVAAKSLLCRLVEGDQTWALPWPCVYEYLRVVTHPRLFRPPSGLVPVLDDLNFVLASPSVIPLGEGPAHFKHLQRMATAADAHSNLAFDAHIAALVVEHGVDELWTLDRDFSRFPGVRTRNPFAR